MTPSLPQLWFGDGRKSSFERVGAAVLEETGKKVGYWALKL